MPSALNILQTAGQLMTHSSERQALIARNIAHADTPGYRALDITPFSDLVGSDRAFAPSQTRAGHADSSGTSIQSAAVHELAEKGNVSPDGNSVALEDQMIRAQEAARAHRRAVTIYRHSIDQLRTALGR